MINKAQIGLRKRTYEIFCNSTIINMVAERMFYVMSDKCNTRAESVVKQLSSLSRTYIFHGDQLQQNSLRPSAVPGG